MAVNRPLKRIAARKTGVNKLASRESFGRRSRHVRQNTKLGECDRQELRRSLRLDPDDVAVEIDRETIDPQNAVHPWYARAT